MSLLIVAISGAVIAGTLYAHTLFAQRNDGIPTIPLYTNIISILRSETRNEFYERNLKLYLHGSGVVRTWLAGHWSLLITHPGLLAEVFRNEKIYAKAGFHVKAPSTVLGHLFGANIGDSHGDEWKLFRTYMKPGLQDRPADYEALNIITTRFVDKLLSEQRGLRDEGSLKCDDTVRKWAIDAVGSHFFNTDFQALTNAKAPVMKLWKAITDVGHSPIRSIFPMLEIFDWFVPSRRNMHQSVEDFHNHLAVESESRFAASAARQGVPTQRCVSDGLVAGYLDGKLNKSQLCCNLTVTFINGHENVLALTKSAMWELGRRPELQSALRREALCTNPRTKADMHSMPLLASVVFEVGRLYPPLSQLANRVTVEATLLGGKYRLAKGQWIGWNAYGVHTSTAIWGIDALEFRPERWGGDVEAIDKMFRRCQNNCTYITWNAHARKCMGISFAILLCKMVLCEMVKRVKWTVDPAYKYTTKHGSVLSPQNVPMIFKEVPKPNIT